MRPSLLASAINILEPFATNKNKNGDKGQLYMTPLEELKMPAWEPFMRTTKETKSMDPMI